MRVEIRGDAVREARTLLRLTQAELAVRAKLDPMTVSRLERGLHRMNKRSWESLWGILRRAGRERAVFEVV